MGRIILLKNKTVPSDPYDALFSEKQHEPVFLPLLKHSSINQTEVKSFLTSETYLREYQALIVTSQRCIEALADLVNELRRDGFDRLDSILNKPSYTVGPTTYQYLKDLGFNDIRGGKLAGNGSILSDIIIKDPLFEQTPKKVLFLTGEIRKDIIPRKLKAKSFNVLELVSYRTEPLADIGARYVEATRSPPQNSWLVFFSPQGTTEIVRILKQNDHGLQIASIGPTTEEYLLANGITPAVVSPKPDAASLAASIAQYEHSL
ncbi:hypothetical protein OGAPHI_003286 [Ogataea philodendri]|uniref:Tetrapyrrole biosynthesis uroporphyrinogen III synthase domain-containing protein n=1 Tax=Ogataea philodendri TaxID=1378263 RepID=A0A9P8P8M6_9ASCO|nr:uncharacterized protein OGAPHI_003286 [Ogataea philodendri]KAH3666837.1 hypothetical protein OGAPHI_003286 [Ogataea philodendri]